ncbi:chromosomal replication initiator DnaA [Aureimonas fodinaquatilis]|uniref:Chromosomal replication initiator DnaA n=1 Tax=Aureimonas fodinaquatilis TaxID=2565783 RepID=A0A5B0DXM3_9HYPH|nr:helix-turn-helix domain-containing protein [Aureimonas fodinaquatilis]KAA0971098.1 chromosomal replication initiator DnaA [Aureimonas fodinaquatilis]
MIQILEVVQGGGDKISASASQRRESDRACSLAISIAGAFFDKKEDEISSPSRSSAAACEARHIAIYLAHVVFQQPHRSIAAAFARDRTSITHALRRVEDRRDDVKFDALLCRMERLAASCRDQLNHHSIDEGVAQ